MNVIFDPRWPRRRLARVGMDISFAWLTLNKIKLPDQVYFDRKSSGDLLEPSWLGAQQTMKGVSRLAVAVSKCPKGMRTTSVIHSPGSFEDYTPLGVFCHEIGHHVDHNLHPKGFSNMRSCGFRRAVDEEVEVSEAESNILESFAEAIRLFITNPNLLEVGRPARWDYLRSRYKPLHNSSWRTVLSKAPPLVHRAIGKWMDDG